MVDEDGQQVPVDTGFMVYNEVTYPLLTRLFSELEVPTKQTRMSFSVQHLRSGTEWNGDRFSTLFAQRRNLLSLRHWRFLLQLNRFNKEAVTALDEAEWAEMNLAEYVDARGYGQDFLDRYLVPMSSAVWSTPPEKMLKFPAMTLLRFWFNHGFLGLSGQHQWRTIDGGSREYVKLLIRPFEDRIHTRTPVTAVSRVGNAVEVTTDREGGQSERFDRVILAAHADQSLRILSDPTTLEQELLSRFAYQPNDVDLHTDQKFMPGKRLAWGSWNYRSNRDNVASIHYWMNCLQGVSEKTEFFVSLNTRGEIAPDQVRKNLQYEHPLFDLPAISAQRRLPELNEKGPVHFCGSYFRYGFHEDAFKSAVDLSRHLLKGDPWARA
jgi:predicted NAD/FAD-binding protein